MITDAQLTFSDAQAVTVTAASANQIDLQAARNLSRTGMAGMRLIVLATTAFAGGTSIAVTVRQSAAANMGSPDIIATGLTVALANLTAGAKLLDIAFPNTDPVAAKRYIDLNYTVVGTMSSGALSAFLVLDTDGGHYALGNVGGSVV